MNEDAPITQLLTRAQAGDASASNELTSIVYAELHRMAARQMSGERSGHTLTPTALVHEAYLRLAGVDLQWEHRRHFFAMAATMMRRILVDHAKAKRRNKRGGGTLDVPLDGLELPDKFSSFDFLSLDYALQKLGQFDARKVSVVELIFFVGLTQEEAAEILNTSPATVKRELTAAKAWLYREMHQSPLQDVDS